MERHKFLIDCPEGSGFGRADLGRISEAIGIGAVSLVFRPHVFEGRRFKRWPFLQFAPPFGDLCVAHREAVSVEKMERILAALESARADLAVVAEV
jgi:hypothetical protein